MICNLEKGRFYAVEVPDIYVGNIVIGGHGMELFIAIPLWLIAGGVWNIVANLYSIEKDLSNIDEKLSKEYRL